MAKQGPRIYVYKITFYEVLHYYYGLHKEKRFDEYYMGSPVTHKDFWELYTPKKEYIEFFEYSDEGYTEARIFEDSLIAPVYQTDPLCLNEHCGGFISLEVLRKNYELGIGIHGRSKEKMSEDGKKGGKISGQKTYELGIGVHGRSMDEMSAHGKKMYELKLGIHGRSKEEMIEHGKICGKISYELGIGVHGRSKEKMSEDGKKGGKKCYELGIGVHGRTEEEMSRNGKKFGKIGGKISGEKHKQNKTGVCGRSKEKMSEDGKKAGKAGAKVTNSQKWQCTVTGYVSNPGGLSQYQKKRGIDTSNRIRIQ
jgi:hypothetical protein